MSVRIYFRKVRSSAERKQSGALIDLANNGRFSRASSHNKVGVDLKNLPSAGRVIVEGPRREPGEKRQGLRRVDVVRTSDRVSLALRRGSLVRTIAPGLSGRVTCGFSLRWNSGHVRQTIGSHEA